MSYLRAEEILPPELLSQVQQYAEGQTLYVPKRNNRRIWGAVSGALSSNRIAADDNPLLLMSLALRPLAEPPFPIARLRELADALQK